MSEKKIFVVDSQRLNCIQMCMTRYRYQFGKSFDPMETPIQFERGTLMHAGMEFYYNARKLRDQWNTLGLQHADIVEQAIDKIRTDSVEMHIAIEEVEDVIRVYQEYTTYYANDGWDNILFTEKVASKVMYEDDEIVIVYEGKIDLGIALSNYPIMIVDHKTEKRKNPASDMTNQFMGYCWLLDTQNIIINRIGMQTTVKPADKFIREVLSYSKARLEEWKNNSIFWIKQAIQYIEHDIYPMNLTSCDKYSGCTYRSVCKCSPEDRDLQLQKLFQIRETQWDVGATL